MRFKPDLVAIPAWQGGLVDGCDRDELLRFLQAFDECLYRFLDVLVIGKSESTVEVKWMNVFGIPEGDELAELHSFLSRRRAQKNMTALSCLESMVENDMTSEGHDEKLNNFFNEWSYATICRFRCTYKKFYVDEITVAQALDELTIYSLSDENTESLENTIDSDYKILHSWLTILVKNANDPGGEMIMPA